MSEELDYNTLMRSYFDRTPYKTEYLADADGNMKPVRVACDPPTVDGFCARYEIPMERLGSHITADTASLCLSKFKDIMVINGVQGLYEAGPWNLTMKNLARWADKSESVLTRVNQEIGLDEAERIIKFLAERRLREVTAVPSPALPPVIIDG